MGFLFVALTIVALVASEVAQLSGFDFKEIRINKEFFRIHIEDVDSLFQDSYLLASESLVGPVVARAHDFCSNYSHSDDDGRCLPLALYTLRGIRVSMLYHKINKLGLAAFGEHTNEGLTTSYSYVYDRVLSGDRNICIFGPLSMQLYVYIRMFSGARSIFLFVRTDNHVESDIILTRKLSADDVVSVVTIHLHDYDQLREIDEYIGSCDVLHVRESDVAQVRVVVGAVSTARVKFQPDTVPEVRLKVVWERIISASTPCMSYSDLDRVSLHIEDAQELSYSLHWESNVYGQNVVKYNLMVDSQGFFARTFYPTELEKENEYEFPELIVGTVELFLDTVTANSTATLDDSGEALVEHVRLTPELNMLPDSASAPLHFASGVYAQLQGAKAALAQSQSLLLGASASVSIDGLSDVKRFQQPIAITYTCRVFGETARGLQQSLLLLGYKHVFILPEMNIELHEALMAHMQEIMVTEAQAKSMAAGLLESESVDTNTNSKSPQVDILQIAIAPMEVQMLLPNYVAIQLEQIWSPFFSHFYTRYSRILSNAVGLWSFSDKLTADLRNSRAIVKSNGETELVLASSTRYEGTNMSALPEGDLVPTFDSTRLFTVPLLADSVRNEKLVKKHFGHTSFFSALELSADLHTAAVSSTQTISKNDDFYLLDALIFGGGSSRRSIVLTEMFNILRMQTGSQVPRDAEGNQLTLDGDRGAEYITLMSYDPHLRIGYSVGSWDKGIFDDDRDYYVLHSKVIINVHSADDSSLELHRINYLTSLGKCVISERSMLDPGLDEAYEYTGYSFYNASVRTAAIAATSSPHGSDARTGGVVFVDDHKDFVPLLLELIGSDSPDSAVPDLRREVEAQAYKYYHDTVRQNISQLDIAVAEAISHMI